MAEDDDSTVVTVTGDPSKGEDVVAVGTGDTIKESEQDAEENPNFRFDDDDDGGGGGGGSSSSSESSSSSGSQTISGSSSDNDDSSSVIVTGDPGSEEGQTTVGVGDDLEEAQADAAANPDFDAAEGSKIDSIEESIGADGAADQDSSSVVVTGGPGTGKPQKVVGQGSTTLQARRDAARNQRFDAAQGEPVDALESMLDLGQGNTTKATQLIQNQRKTAQPSKKRQDQAREDQQLKQFQPFQRAQKLQSARQKRNERIQKAKQESGLAGKSLITGVEIMQAGQKFGDKIAEKTVGRLENPLEDLFNPEIVTERGQTVENQRLENQFQSSGSKKAERRTQSFRDISQDFTSGVAAGPSQLGGLAVAIPGAVARATREDTPSIATGAVKGADLTVTEFKKDPSKFLAEEAGEEVSEAAAGALIGGPVGAVIGATPIPKITPSIETKAVESERFLRGDLGTQVENERIITKPFPAEGSAQSASFKRETKKLEDGGRAQQAVRVNPGDETVTVGQRKETPVTRRDVLQENLDAGKETVDTFLSGNAIGMGPGALLPDETSPNVEPETQPETLPEQDLFKDTKTGGDTFVGQASRPDLQTVPSVDTTVQEDVELGDTPVQETDPQTEDEPIFEPPKIVFEQETSPSLENPPSPPVIEQEITPDTPFLEPPTQEPPVTPSPPGSDDSEPTDTILGFTDPGADESPEAAPSVDAILFGETTDEEVEDDTVFSGFETREVSEEFNLF